MSKTDDVEFFRDCVLADLASLRVYTTYPEARFKVVDELIAAVRAATLREVREYLASEEFIDALAHVVDDISPRTTHEGDRQDARVYGKYAAQKVHHKFTEGR